LIKAKSYISVDFLISSNWGFAWWRQVNKITPFVVSLLRWYCWKCIAFRDSKLYFKP